MQEYDDTVSLCVLLK